MRREPLLPFLCLATTQVRKRPITLGVISMMSPGSIYGAPKPESSPRGPEKGMARRERFERHLMRAETHVNSRK